MADNKKYGFDGDEYSLESILNEDYESDESFTLESILAEYKSEAYMAGDKRTPPEVLQKQTDDILREVTGRENIRPDTKMPHEPEREQQVPAAEDDGIDALFSKSVHKRRAGQDEKPITTPSRHEKAFKEDRHKRHQKIEEPVVAEPERKTPVLREPEQSNGNNVLSVDDFFVDSAPSAMVNDEVSSEAVDATTDAVAKNEEASAPEIISDAVSDDDLRFFESFDFAKKNAALQNREVEETVAQGGELEEQDDGPSPIFGRLFHRRGTEVADDFDDDVDEYIEPEEDPDIHSEISRYAKYVPSLRMRTAGATILCVLMLLLTHLFTKGTNIPLGIGTSAELVTGILLIMQLIVMMLGIEVLIDGVTDVVKVKPGAESLIVVSCIVSLLDGFVMLISGHFDNGLPFSLVSACSVAFAMSARNSYYKAMCNSLKTSISSSSPYGVISEDESIQDRFILKKIPGAYKGFYSRITEADFGELTYNHAAPLFIVVSLAFAVLTSIGRSRAGDFAHTFSVMTAVSAAFPAAAVFSMPFKYASARAKKTGGAIAGWGGASDIFYSDGALLTDLDLYPVGTVSLSGLKLFEGVSQRKAITYTSSLIIASGSGLTKVFEELLKSQSLSLRSTSDFACYEGGGIGAVIDGERVLVGTSAFMNLMGIRVPDSVNTKSSIFTAINDELAAVFAINYVPSNSIQSALVTLLNTRTNILMAVRDFNVTPNAIQQKFKVSMEGVEYMPVETTYKLSDTEVPKGCGASAVLCRGGLAPFTEIIFRGRLLKQITEINTIISVAGTAIALLIMLFLCWTASFASASVENAFIFMIVIEFCVFLISQVVKKRI